MVSEISAGMEFGRYRLERQLATGGMGAVWVARDRTLVREVAVKLLPPMFTTDPSSAQRFEREARAMGRLQHPNVVSIFDIGTARLDKGEDVPYLVMEYIRGTSVDQMIGEGPVPTRRAIKIVVQVAKALAEAHRAGVIHRDLKPSNIMITGDGTAKVLDFGLARLVRSGNHSQEATLTAPGMVLGSCPYMAPEQAMGGKVQAQADIYSLGTVMYEMLSGQRAFTGATPVHVLQSVIRGRYTPLGELMPRLSPALVAIVGRCLEHEPSKRYAFAENLIHDLEAYLDSGRVEDPEIPTMEMGTSSIEALRIRRRRRRIRVGGFAAAVLAVGATVGFVGGRWGEEQLRPDPGRWRSAVVYEAQGSIRHLGWSPMAEELVAEIEQPRGFEIRILPLEADRASRVLARSNEAGAPIYPAPAPDGSAFAITRLGEATMSVEVVPAVGGAPVATLDNAGRATWLDSGRLLVSRITDGATGLWIWEPESGRVEPYLPPASDRQYWQAFPRPGGGFAVLGGGSDSRAGVYVGDSVDGELSQWLAAGSLVEGLAWHPDGRSMAISIGRRLHRLDGDGERPLLSPIEGLSNPAFDDTGRLLAAVSQTSSYDIMAVDPVDGEMRCLKCGDDRTGWGSLGPEGSLYYRRDIRGRPALTVADPRTDDENPLFQIGAGASCPSVSPDGRRVAYLAVDPEGGYDLKVVALEGGEPVTLASGVESSEFPSWSPDGRFLAYAAGSPLKIWVCSAAGGTPRDLGPATGDYPMWSPDGRWIAYVVWTDASDPDQGAWIVPPEGGEPIQVSRLPTRLAWSADGTLLRQLRREGDAVVVYEAVAGTRDWNRRGVFRFADGAPEHFEFQPLTVDPSNGDLVVNLRTTRAEVVVFDGLDPRRW